jgi:hypothetical protein
VTEAVRQFHPPLDPGIERAVLILRAAGVETYESCEGSPGHAVPEPTVFFNGERTAGWQALAAAQDHGLDVLALRRVWTVINGEPVGPTWEMTFRRPT